MPRVLGADHDGRPVERYSWGAARVVDPECDAALRQWRREAVQSRERVLAKQKTCSDRDRARCLKDLANHWLRLQRACTLALPWLGEPDTGQAVMRPEYWPLDMSEELDEIAVRLSLRFG